MPRIAKLPTYIRHQLLTLEKTPGPGWNQEIKFAGYRMQVHVTAAGVTWYSRNGNDWSGRFSDLDAELMDLGPCILDGELCIVDARGHPDFSALRSALGYRQKGTVKGDLTLFVFDILADRAQDCRGFALSVRRTMLAKRLADHADGHLRVVEGFNQGGAALLRSACQMGLEGVVSKRLDGPYKFGERNATWIRSKRRPSQDVVMGRYETDGVRFKSLLAGVYERGKLRHVGHLSTGFSQKTLTDLLPRLKAVVASENPFDLGEPPRKTSDVHWARPELVAAAEIAEWTSAGKLRQASFKGLREDKAARQVVREAHRA